MAANTLTHFAEREAHVGIRNVHLRNGDEACGLTIESAPGAGTTVKIVLAALKEAPTV